MVGMEEGIFPHANSMNLDPLEMEEERRLCYVGITRARKKLYMSHAQMRRLYGTENYCLPSRFLSEIPKEVIEEIGYNPKKFFNKKRPVAVKSTYKENSIMGKRVMHKKFGEGVVIAAEGSDTNTRVQVSFDIEGDKWLILAIANLEVI
jgi:DNA helicase-2/ATP-dependent DNA helicase PcrA